MKTYQVRLTEQEERLFIEGLRNNLSSISWTLIQKAYKRGDIKKVNDKVKKKGSK